MCRCGVSCDYIYKSLMRAETEGKTMGFKVSVDMLFPEDESVNAETSVGDINQPQVEV